MQRTNLKNLIKNKIQHLRLKRCKLVKLSRSNTKGITLFKKYTSLRSSKTFRMYKITQLLMSKTDRKLRRLLKKLTWIVLHNQVITNLNLILNQNVHSKILKKLIQNATKGLGSLVLMIIVLRSLKIFLKKVLSCIGSNLKVNMRFRVYTWKEDTKCSSCIKKY